MQAAAVGSNPAYGSTGVALTAECDFPKQRGDRDTKRFWRSGRTRRWSPGETFGNEVATPGMPRFPALGPGSGNIGYTAATGAGTPWVDCESHRSAGDRDEPEWRRRRTVLRLLAH